jgi:hypothetical protein
MHGPRSQTLDPVAKVAGGRNFYLVVSLSLSTFSMRIEQWVPIQYAACYSGVVYEKLDCVGT